MISLVKTAAITSALACLWISGASAQQPWPDSLQCKTVNPYDVERFPVNNDVEVGQVEVWSPQGQPVTVSRIMGIGVNGIQRTIYAGDPRRIRDSRVRFRTSGHRRLETIVVEARVPLWGAPWTTICARAIPAVVRQSGNRKLLACQTVGTGESNDIFRVTRDEGTFTGLRFLARRGAPIILREVRVVHFGGRVERFDDVRASVPSRERRLADNSPIERVEVSYENPDRPGEVCIYGESITDVDQRADNPTLLACQTVRAGERDDIFRVTRDEGRFTGLRFQSRKGAPIMLDEVRVVHFGGNDERFRHVRASVPARERRLRDDNPIERVEVTYGTPTTDGEVCIYGER